MYCENRFCVFWKHENSCLQQKIHLDELGRCREFVSIQIWDAELSIVRARFFAEPDTEKPSK